MSKDQDDAEKNARIPYPMEPVPSKPDLGSWGVEDGARWCLDDDGNKVYTNTSSWILYPCVICHHTKLGRRGVCNACLQTEINNR